MATRKDERIVTFDYDELATFSDTVCELVPLSQKDVSVLVSCLRVAHWVARWFAGDKLLRELGRFTDIEDALTYIENLERKLLMSGCLEGLITVMGEIRDAIRAQAQCCQNSSNGLHMVDLGEGDLVYGTEQPLTPPTTFGGEGEFEDEAAFIEHRCSAANNIVAGLILSLNSWSALSLVSLLAGGLVVAFFVANPPLGVMLALAMVGFAFGVLLTISNYIADNRETWVCAIFNADDYQTFLANIDSRIADMVVTLDIGAFELEVTELIHSVLNTDTFNKMFTVIGLPEVQDAVDCDACGDDTSNYTVSFYDAQHDWEITQYAVNCGWDDTNNWGFQASGASAAIDIVSPEGLLFNFSECWIGTWNLTNTDLLGLEVLGYIDEQWVSLGTSTSAREEWHHMTLNTSAVDCRVRLRYYTASIHTIALYNFSVVEMP